MRAGRDPELALPSPEVRFGPDFLRRVELLCARMAGARERREGAGRAFLRGAGEEFAGYRPYRAGEDLRQLDWNLFARLDKPFVRVMRREAGERWLCLLDASASMGVGPPGKLQRAAEVAAAVCALGARLGASARLFASTPGDEPLAQIELRRRDGPRPLLDFLETRRAQGSGGMAKLLAQPSRFLEGGRVFAIGDLIDVEPDALLRLARSGRELAAVSLLAPIELEPAERGAIEWWDPESGERARMRVDEAAAREYRERLDARLERWRTSAARHGIAFGCWSSATEFEDVVRALARR